MGTGSTREHFGILTIIGRYHITDSAKRNEMANNPPNLNLISFLIIFLFLNACSPRSPDPIVIQPTNAEHPTPTSLPAPSITVCDENCDFATIQDALDSGGTEPNDVIGIRDRIHTEANIQITKSIVLQGLGATNTIVQADANVEHSTERVFFVAPNTVVTLRDLTIQNGNPKSDPRSGGGVRNEGTLTIERVVIQNNWAAAGGGILNIGNLTMIESTIRKNKAIGGGIGVLECDTGGGMKVLEGNVRVFNSTFSDNEARGRGGAVHIACKGKVQLENSTISTNWSNESGGGLYVNGVAEMTHLTIAENHANSGGGIGFSGSGEEGVIHGQISSFNSIIANNIARMEKYGTADCHQGDLGTIDVNTFNWIADGTCSPSFSGDPMLAPLESNHALTQTHALLEGSPAIDLIPIEACPLTRDQREFIRSGTCDPGAFEVQQP
jgi:hypothetical protein